MPTNGYEFFEHTADVGVRVRAATLAELFEQAAQGLTALIVTDGIVQPTERRPVDLRADSAQELLQTWLKQVLAWFNADRFVFAQGRFDAATETQLKGQAAGERFNPSRHAAGTEIKGVTYHHFEVGRTPAGWQAEVIVDV